MHLVEELGGLQVGEAPAERLLGPFGNGLEEREGDVSADDGGSLQKALVLGRQPVDPGGQHGLHRGRHLNAWKHLRQAIRPTLADQGLGLGQGPDALLQKEGVPLGPLDQALLERLEAGVVTEKGLEEFLGARRWQGIEPELGIVSLVPPAMLVLRAGS